MGLVGESVSVYVDSSVLLTAVGGANPRRAACVQFLNQASDGRWRVHLSVEAVQEFVFHRLRRGDPVVGVAQARHLVDAFIIHPFDEHILLEALRLLDTSRVRGRDAVHAATALLGGFDRIVTLDSDFDAVPGLTAVSPEELITDDS